MISWDPPMSSVQERLSRSSVSTDDTDTDTEPHEATGPIREGREGREGGSLGHGHPKMEAFCTRFVSFNMTNDLYHPI